MTDTQRTARPPTDIELADGVTELRANTLISLAGAERPVLAVTSPHAREDRRHVASQLAAALAQTSRTVALIDADAVPQAPRAAPPPADGPVDRFCVEAVSQGDPALLVAPAFVRDLRAYQAAHDIVVVACPPVLEVPESRAVATACTATLLVVAHWRSNRDDAMRAVHLLRAAQVRMLGAVIHDPA